MISEDWDAIFLRRVVVVGDCIEFTGARDRKGYGRQLHDGKIWLSHRVSHVVAIGPIRDGMFVCHKCDNPSCVNPHHLFQGGLKENTDDMLRKGRSQKRRGEGHSQVKLSEADVIAIRQDRRIHRVIANEYGITIGYVSNLKIGYSWGFLKGDSVRMGYARGQNVASSKLSYEIAGKIRADQRNLATIAREHGVCRTTVRNIKRGLIWVKGQDDSLPEASGRNA